jgi:tripeptide aminopeptidase
MFLELVDQVLDLAIAIQQIPAPTFAEGERSEFVRQRFQAERLLGVEKDSIGNVYACLPGDGNALPVVVSAHLDTVFPADTDLSIYRSAEKIGGPGIGDNSIGVAGLFGLIWALRMNDRSLSGDVWLVANVGEEGLGDLCGMRAVTDRFSDRVAAYIVLEGMALGHIYNRGLGVRRYKITVNTAGGHSWVDYGRPSAVHELAALISGLTALPIPDQPRTTLNVGVIRGGTTINSIAAEAYLELDLRSEQMAELERLSAKVERLAVEAIRPEIAVAAEVIGFRPPGELSADDRLVRLAQRSLRAQGLQPLLHIGSTDANIPLSRGIPAVCLGLTTGSGAHTKAEFIRTQPVVKGLAQLVNLVELIYQDT